MTDEKRAENTKALKAIFPNIYFEFTHTASLLIPARLVAGSHGCKSQDGRHEERNKGIKTVRDNSIHGALAHLREQERWTRECEHCYKLYTVDETRDVLTAMFGSIAYVDEDYYAMIDGLCPSCWPEY